MNIKKEVILFVLSLAGVLFSGYLSGVKFFQETCAFGESCPYVFGISACYYGFVMFVVLFGSSICILKKFKKELFLDVMFYVSIVGMLFAGYLTIQELFFPLCIGPCKYALVLPTCAYGFVVYLAVFISTILTKFSKK